MVKRDRRGRFADKVGGGVHAPLDEDDDYDYDRRDLQRERDREIASLTWMDKVNRDMGRRFDPPAPAATPAASGREPMTDAEFEQRAQMVTDVIGKAMKTMSTDRTHTNEHGRWNTDRDRLHREIADELYARAASVPNQRRAVIAGGLGGAGKTTVLTKHAGIDPSEYITLNPDDVKELMAGRGLIPEVPGHPDLSPMERAALVHEESSRITSLVADMALRDGKNMMWDITMSSSGSVEKRIAALKAAGYREINGVFVDIPVEVSVSRAMSRYRRGADKHLAGKGPGGRFVPPAIIRAQRTSSGETINRGVFDSISDQFSTWSMYDNSVTGRDPQLIKKKKGR